MEISIQSTDEANPRPLALGGAGDEISLVIALLTALATERMKGHARLVLNISLNDADPAELVAIARSIWRPRDHATRHRKGMAVQLPIPVDPEAEPTDRLRDRI